MKISKKKLVEGDAMALKNLSHSMRPSERVSSQFKEMGKRVEGSNIKFENASTNRVNISMISFAHKMVDYLKALLTEPSIAGKSQFWVKLSLTPDELLGSATNIGLVTKDGDSYKVHSNNFSANIEKLYDELINKDYVDDSDVTNELSLGDDVEETTTAGGSSGSFTGAFSVGSSPMSDLKTYSPEEQINDSDSDIIDEYDYVFDEDKFNDESGVEETTTAASSGSYVQPKIWAKDKKNWRNRNNPMYPNGQVVDDTEIGSIVEGKLKSKAEVSYMLSKTNSNCGNCKHFDKGMCSLVFGEIKHDYVCDLYESRSVDESNLDSTAYPSGEFVEFDDCVKLNNNDKAQKGGCSVGAVDNVVKTRKSKKFVISKEALYYEVMKRNKDVV